MTSSPAAHRRPTTRLTTALALAFGLVAVTACNQRDGREMPPARPDQTASVLTTTIAPSTTARLVEPDSPELLSTLPATGFNLQLPWIDDADIPADHTCKGSPTHDVAPRFTWTSVPAGTVELAIVLTDQTADGYVLWAMSGIDPNLGVVEAGVVPAGAIRATNSTGALGYSGPCPPSGTHVYLAELFAIGQQLELSDGALAADAITAIETAAIDSATVSGIVAA